MDTATGSGLVWFCASLLFGVDTGNAPLARSRCAGFATLLKPKASKSIFCLHMNDIYSD